MGNGTSAMDREFLTKFFLNWDLCGADMTKDNAMAYLAYSETQKSIVKPSFIAYASSAGFSFSAEDLKQALNARICNAESLPRPWGWPLARKLGLVRS